MGVSNNSGTPKSSILIGFSIINHPFWGVPLFLDYFIHIAGFCDILKPEFLILIAKELFVCVSRSLAL